MGSLDAVLSSRADGRLVLDIGWLTLLMGRGVDATRRFDDAHRRDPSSLWALRGLGLAFAEREIEVRAVALLGRAAEREPDHAETWYWIGEFAPRDTHAALALTAFTRATEISPEVADFWAARAGREADEEALRSLERAVALDPHNVEAWSTAAWVHDHLGRTAEAIEAARRLIALRRTPATLRVLARALRAAGEYDEAGAVSHDAVSLEDAPGQRAVGPMGGRGRFGMVARLLLERGHLESLKQAYLSGARSEPAAEEFWWSFAGALTEGGRFADALAMLDRVVDASDDDAPFIGRVHRDRAILLEALDRPGDAATAWELMRMHQDFARFERSGISALAVGPYGGANVAWTTAAVNIADPWTRRVRPFQEDQTEV